MDLKRYIFCLILFVASITAKKNATGYANANANEYTPIEKLKKDIQDLPKDPLLKIKGFEDIAALVADRLENGEGLETDDVNVYTHEYTLARLSQETTAKETLVDLGGNFKSRIHIPTDKIRKTPHGRHAKKLTVVTAWWKNIASLPAPEGALLPRNTSLLSVTYYLDFANNNHVKESLAVDYYIDLENDFTEILSIKPNQRLRGFNRTCAWLDLQTNTWNESGCITTYDKQGVNCVCDHTTTFVTLLTLDTIELPQEVYPVTMVFEVTSIICLVLTILFISVARHGAGINSAFTPLATGMNANRTNSQVSLCFSLLCTHLVIVWSDAARNGSDKGCVAITSLTHYFFLASAFWSLCEGVGIFVKVCPPLTMSIQYRTMTIIQAIVGWIAPLVMTIFTAAYGIQRGTYMDLTLQYKQLENKTQQANSTEITAPMYEECWLSRENGTVWAALGPLIIITTLNLVILFYVAKEVVKMNRTHPARDLELSESQYSSSKSNTLRRGTSPTPAEPPNAAVDTSAASGPVGVAMQQRRRASYMVSVTRSFGVLMPILAVPWILSIFSNINGAGAVFATAHAVVNGLQGLELFILYCVANKRDRRIVTRKWRNSNFRRFFCKYRYNRRDSVATFSGRVTSYDPKVIATKVDANGNTYLSAGWKGTGNMAQYDTLSSGRSSSGTINSTLSRKSPVSKSAKWWKS